MYPVQHNMISGKPSYKVSRSQNWSNTRQFVEDGALILSVLSLSHSFECLQYNFLRTDTLLFSQTTNDRFAYLLLQIKLGTVDQSEAQNEYVNRPYMNTAKKQKILGD